MLNPHLLLLVSSMPSQHSIRVDDRDVRFKAVAADAQCDSAKVREKVREYGAEPIIPYGKRSEIGNALEVGTDFVVRGVKRLVNLFRRRVSIERVFSRAKEWLLLDHLRVRGLEKVFIHTCPSFSAMLIIALTAARQHKPRLIRSIKYHTTQ